MLLRRVRVALVAQQLEAGDEALAREARLEKELQVEVLNFGVSDADTRAEVNSLEGYALSIQPDVVLLALFLSDAGREGTMIFLDPRKAPLPRVRRHSFLANLALSGLHRRRGAPLTPPAFVGVKRRHCMSTRADGASRVDFSNSDHSDLYLPSVQEVPARSLRLKSVAPLLLSSCSGQGAGLSSQRGESNVTHFLITEVSP